MENYTIRRATIADIDFLVDTIIEAEKSGTDTLSYSTIFGLNEIEAKKIVRKMLEEEVDGCDLSISGFLVIEFNGEIAAAVNAWIEGEQEISSSSLKGNLLNYHLPKESISKAVKLSPVFSELSIECSPNTLCFGPGYVNPNYRGRNLLGILCQEHINQTIITKPFVKEVYAQIFSNNIPSIRIHEKLGFIVVEEIIAKSESVKNILPSNRKLLLKKQL